MNIISKDNLKHVMIKYRNFHDCNFINIKYDIYNKTINADIQLYWKQKESGEYERTKNLLKIVFNSVVECKIRENESCDFIKEAIMKYTEIEDLGERILFSSDENNPLFYVVCEVVQFEEKEEVEKI